MGALHTLVVRRLVPVMVRRLRRLLGVLSLLGSVLIIAIVLIAAGVLAWPFPIAIARGWLAEPEHAIAATGICLVVGTLLYYVKQSKLQSVYGACEIILGSLSCWIGFSETKKDVAYTLAIAGGIYIIVRGIENFMKGREAGMKLWRERKTYHFKGLKLYLRWLQFLYGRRPPPSALIGPKLLFAQLLKADAAAKAGQFTYNIVPGAPVVTSISPSNGNPAGGDTIMINGSGFTGVTAVSFGLTPATSFTFVSDTQITAVSPPDTKGGIVNVNVTTPLGCSAAPQPASAVLEGKGPLRFLTRVEKEWLYRQALLKDQFARKTR